MDPAYVLTYTCASGRDTERPNGSIRSQTLSKSQLLAEKPPTRNTDCNGRLKRYITINNRKPYLDWHVGDEFLGLDCFDNARDRRFKELCNVAPASSSRIMNECSKYSR